MKKIFAITISLTLFATAAMAATATGVTTETQSLVAVTPVAGPIAKASKNVKFGWYCTGDGTGYAINTTHTSGTKSYGTAADATQIMVSDTAVVPWAFPASSSSSAAFGTGWSAM